MTLAEWSPPDFEDAPTFGRRETLLLALRRLQELCPGPVLIVETGTLREDSERACGGDGWSTVAFGWYASAAVGELISIDVDPAALEVCRNKTRPFGPAIRYVCEDSVAFLSRWTQEKSGPIHLLYLDSLDYHDRERSEAHSLAEARAALPSLARPSLVLLDDTFPTGETDRAGCPTFSGKGAQSVTFLLSEGLQLEWATAGQVLLMRGEDRRAPELFPSHSCQSPRRKQLGRDSGRRRHFIGIWDGDLREKSDERGRAGRRRRA